jgi:hypothetical protein
MNLKLNSILHLNLLGPAHTCSHTHNPSTPFPLILLSADTLNYCSKITAEQLHPFKISPQPPPQLHIEHRPLKYIFIQSEPRGFYLGKEKVTKCR